MQPLTAPADTGQGPCGLAQSLSALPQDLLRTLQRAANRLDLDVDGLTAEQIAERYSALGCQITPDFAARIQREAAAARSGHGQPEAGNVDDGNLAVTRDENNGSGQHARSVGTAGGTLAALLSTLQDAEQFIAGFEGDEAQQPPVADLLANLRAQILVTQAAIDSEAAHAATRYEIDPAKLFADSEAAHAATRYANACVGTAVPGEDPAAAAARKAIYHLLLRIQRDPQLAWYFDPLTRSMEELTEAHALMYGLDLPAFRSEYFATLAFERPKGGDA